VVAIEEVGTWWIDCLGVGHVLLSECSCGQCTLPFQALCGVEGTGTKTGEVPERICRVCRHQLALPTMRKANYVGYSMRTVTPEEAGPDA
jgi:hypothetical protein